MMRQGLRNHPIEDDPLLTAVPDRQWNRVANDLKTEVYGENSRNRVCGTYFHCRRDDEGQVYSWRMTIVACMMLEERIAKSCYMSRVIKEERMWVHTTDFRVKPHMMLHVIPWSCWSTWWRKDNGRVCDGLWIKQFKNEHGIDGNWMATKYKWIKVSEEI